MSRRGRPRDRGGAGDAAPRRITLVPHTHWDREWYEPFEVFRERLVRMMDGLLDLLERGFPHFHLDGQTAMVDDYLEVRPGREDDLRRHAARGRLSLGPWVTQADEFLVSGETLWRNLERGLARARELGRALEVGYLPDQFGHVGQMPQILRAFGIDRAVLWRGVPRRIDRTPFRWEAPDGSAVTVEYLAFGYSVGWRVPEARDGRDLAELLRETAAQLGPFLLDGRMLVPVGSDHSGPDPGLPAKVEEARRWLPGVDLRVGSLADHLAEEPPAGLPTWRGELRSSARAHLLPNVYSARAHQKRERGEVEALLERYAEPLAALVPGFPWPTEELDRAWTLLLWNAAHDSACGCSHDRVAREVDARAREARAIAEGIRDRALRALAAQVAAPGVLRFNPSPFEREGVPGLGWKVEPPGRARPAGAPLPLALDAGWAVAGEIAFALRDERDEGDLYDFCPAEAGGDLPLEAELLGPDVVGFRGEGVRARVAARRIPGEPFLRLEVEVENARPDHRLRLHLRLPRSARGSVAGAPFELVPRPLASEGSELEAASPTWPARGVVWAGGLAALAVGVVEYEVVGGEELALTLLRCVGTISRERLATRPFPAGPAVPTPEAQMLGTWRASFGVLRTDRTEDLLPAWERFALPLREVPAPGGGHLPATGSLLEVEGAVLSSVRRVGDALEVRVWNPSTSRPARARVGGRRLTLGPARIGTVRLEEVGDVPRTT
ncbi:MAG TPA: hypothetical protein VNO79_09810 [Actinomycetota bacterium]|nr:hypothetical protein [Actinomycetota bacterium]